MRFLFKFAFDRPEPWDRPAQLLRSKRESETSVNASGFYIGIEKKKESPRTQRSTLDAEVALGRM